MIPKLNDTPKYELKIPSLKKDVKFRPYLVKEEKILMMAFESNDQKVALTAVADTVTSCINEEVKVEDLKLYDIEYMFTKIRAKSIGEEANLIITCTECEHKNDVTVNLDDVGNISKALKNGWLITFPQGTTKPFSPIRKGTAHIIMNNKPIVVPIIIDGFRRSFDKTGLRIKKKGIQQSMRIMDPVKFDYKKDSIETITEKIASLIGQ